SLLPRLLLGIAFGHKPIKLFLVLGALEPLEELAERLLVIHELAAKLFQLLELLGLVGFESTVAAVRPDAFRPTPFGRFEAAPVGPCRPASRRAGPQLTLEELPEQGDETYRPEYDEAQNDDAELPGRPSTFTEGKASPSILLALAIPLECTGS